MQNRLFRSLLAIVTLAISPVLLAQSSAQSGSPARGAQTANPQRPAPGAATGASRPDLSGVWGIYTPVTQRARARSFDEFPPMTPWAAEHYKALNEAAKRGNEALDLLDPVITACAPPGLVRLITFGRPFEMIQIPGRVMIVYEWGHWPRYIWTDGREHPKDVDPTWMGHSIGHFDGDTLVVDTVGFNDMTLLDKSHPHSEELHIVERYRRVDHNAMELSMTYADPKVYTKSWSGKITFTLDPKGGPLMEWVDCEERITRQIQQDPCKGTVVWELAAACQEREKLPGEK